ncbi:MAG: hypothetical protein HQ513_16330 [Rhodospirillales bacterium]|nr:hypothetical protein [Rhodospirillales bacterium]
MNLSILLKISSVLWAIWGVFHFMMGSMIYFLSLGNEALSIEAIASDPLMVSMLTEYAPIVTATLKQHFWNIAWAGLVTTVGSYYIWKKSANAIFISASVGGLVDFGYFVFVDLQGLAPPIGTAMTFISSSAIILSFYAYFKSDRLRAI